MELPKIEFHSVVEVVDLIAGLMTIIGISGVVTWSLTSSNKLADGIAGFAAHCLRITIFIFLIGPFFWMWVALYPWVFMRFSGGSFSYVEFLWNSQDPFKSIVSYVVSVPIVLALYLLTCLVIYYWSLRPLVIAVQVLTYGRVVIWNYEPKSSE